MIVVVGVLSKVHLFLSPLPQSWLIRFVSGERSLKGGGHVCMDCQMHKVKCVWSMGHPPGPKEASTSGTFATDTSHPSCPLVEAIHEVAEAIRAMSNQQAELGHQQAKNSRAILSMSQHALKVID